MGLVDTSAMARRTEIKLGLSRVGSRMGFFFVSLCYVRTVDLVSWRASEFLLAVL